MPRTKLLELDPGLTWDTLVEELGNPLTAEPLMSGVPFFDRTGRDWSSFFADGAFDLSEQHQGELASEVTS